MALIGIYSDVHISHSSSILPTYLKDTDKYTTRLNMCKASMNWAYEQFKQRRVYTAVNCGDLFNSHTISSDELDAYIEFIQKRNSDRNYHPTVDCTLIGNHDKFNDNFNSLKMLNITNYSHLIDTYEYVSIIPNWDVYMISFYDSSDFVDNILKMLNAFPRQKSKAILFMHGDINGSMLSGDKRIEHHIATEFLTKYFDVVINGHIHCHERIYNQNNKKIYNIGSLTTHSFADSNNHVPACYIFNTETEEIEQIVNPYGILFKYYTIATETDIQVMCNDLDKISNQIILKIKCSIDFKDKISKILENYSNILKYKFVFIYNKEISNTNIVSKSTSQNVDIKDEFITFLSNRSDLKGDIDDYSKLIN